MKAKTKKQKRKVNTADLGLSLGQKKLYRKHGTPSQFAAACYECVPSMVSVVEARAAIEKYNRQWKAFGAPRS